MNQVNLVDTHAHLYQPEFDADRAQMIERAQAAGVRGILCAGANAATSAAAIGLAEQYPFIRAAVGVHPNYCAEVSADDWPQVVELARHRCVAAIGETGLDRHWDFSPFDLQQDYFDRHLRLAQALNLPVIVHCREAEAETMPMLREAVVRGSLRGVLHACSAEAPVVAECLDMGLYISFAGNITYTNKKFEPLRAVAATIPADRLLIETDSPYLVPHPLRGKEKRNEPAMVAYTAQVLAELRGQSIEELGEQVTANARRLFGLG